MTPRRQLLAAGCALAGTWLLVVAVLYRHGPGFITAVLTLLLAAASIHRPQPDTPTDHPPRRRGKLS